VHSLELNGTGGNIVVQDTVNAYRYQAAGDETASEWRASYFNDAGRSFEQTFDRHVDRIVAALRSGGLPPVPASAGRRALVLALAAIESFETGRRVDVPPPDPS
jgi:predicted dehydrogenase